MPQPRVLILRAPGTNCDQETAFAFQQAGGRPDRIHINRLLERPQLLDEFQILCFPGGFSYGDDIAAGRILATQIRHHLAEPLTRFTDQGKLILGICNGFQILIKSGLLLPDEPDGAAPATLTWNDSRRYEDRWVHLTVLSERCVFLRGIHRLYLPVAHAEGKFIARDEATLDRLESNGQFVLRYADANGEAKGQLAFPQNPNGAVRNVAGVCDQTGRVLGLMPHPERHLDPTQHPRWTRGEAGPRGDGVAIFENAVQFFGE